MVKSIYEIKKYYETCFDNPSSRYSRMMKEMLQSEGISSVSRVLDYGCGSGLVSHYLYQKYGCIIDAVDISKNEIEGAKAAWSSDNVNWIIMDEFSFPEKEYDLIISSQVIEHIHNVGNYLSMIGRMLKKKWFVAYRNT